MPLKAGAPSQLSGPSVVESGIMKACKRCAGKVNF